MNTTCKINQLQLITLATAQKVWLPPVINCNNFDQFNINIYSWKIPVFGSATEGNDPTMGGKALSKDKGSKG